jgi:L-Ala-D/L-Glu epimerase / N-acetyl-D-glutamate racemase
MQIIKAEVTPAEIKLQNPLQIPGHPKIDFITAIFVRLVTAKGESAWGCTVAHPSLTGDKPEDVIRICQTCADKVPDLHPINIEYSLAQISPLTEKAPSALCAFDLAFHDLLGLAAGMPVYRLLGGYRNRIQTSITIPLGSIDESVDTARERASDGFRILKVKGGQDPDLDVRRIKAIHRALPGLTLRLDADGGYSERQALDVAHALKDKLEMLEQPTPAEDLQALREVSRLSAVPILADQSVRTPETALNFATGHYAQGLSVKLALCGGIRCARVMDAITRAAHISMMVSCLIEPAMLIAAGLSFALSSPNVAYGDLDGHLFLIDDPSVAGFELHEGWLTAKDVPGLGYSVNLG